MAEAFYSIVLDHSAADVWSVIRPFGHYAWAGVRGTTIIEDGKASDQVGAVRRVELPGRTIRQLLLAHSDIERSYTYSFDGPPPQPVRDYVATLRVTPVVESGQAFVEWRAKFDCLDAAETDTWIQHFEKKGFAIWLAALRDFMRASTQNVRSYAASSV
jgi:hypothetical protein